MFDLTCKKSLLVNFSKKYKLLSLKLCKSKSIWETIEQNIMFMKILTSYQKSLKIMIKDIVFFLYSNVFFITEISNNFIVFHKKLYFIVNKNKVNSKKGL